MDRAAAAATDTILVVQDNATSRRAMRATLEEAGYAVIEAATAAAAISAVGEHRPDLVVQDLQFADRDGVELADELRTRLGDTETPILCVSGFLSHSTHARARLRGFAHVFVKPVDPAQVVDVVRHHLARPRSASVPPPPSAPLELVEDENARLVQRAALREAELGVLAGVADALARNRPVDGVLGDVLAACLDMAGISNGALYVIRGDRLVLQHHIGFASDRLPALADLFGAHAVLTAIATSSEVVLVPSLAVPAERSAHLLAAAGVQALLLVPVRWSATSFGLMVLGAVAADLAGDDARAFASALGTQMGLALGLAQSFTRLAASEQRYRNLTEHANDAISILARDGTICEVNQRLCDMLGYPAAMLVGKHIGNFAVQGRDQVLADTYTQSVAAGGHQSPPVQIRRADGSIVLVEFSLTPVHVGGEQLVLAIGRDVTEQVGARAQLMTSDRMASVGTLAAGVAHEINNPLAAVLANLDFAMEHALALPAELAGARLGELRDSLADARSAADRVRQIVMDLRIFSRADEARRTAVDVKVVLESTLRMAWNEIRHRARLVTEYGDVPPVDATESRLGQVFLNLIVNAAQAIEEGDATHNELRVATSLDPRGRVIVEVSDSGPGMTPETVASLFVPFFTTKPVGIGTGLGLTICHRIVGDLGGEITVASAPGRGTTFRVALLPAVSMAARVMVGELPSVVAATRRGRVLVVDDDDLLAQALARSLRGQHDVEVHTSARTALDRLVAGSRYDVILCDLMMPDLTGPAFYDRLLAAVPEQAARVVFLSGGAFTAGSREFLERVPNERLDKPFELRVLRALVNARVR